MTRVQFVSASFWLCFAPVLFPGLALHAQIIITNFPGVSFNDESPLGTGSTPPDTMGAAGTNQFVEFINGAFAVYNKAGVRQIMISDTAFWMNAGISSATLSAGLTDTRITYVTGSGRWFASELNMPAANNLVLLARSDSSNPAGTWTAVSFVANSGFGDFDTLGVDSEGVYLSVNDFDTANNFTGVSFFSIPKSDLLASTPTLANMSRFDNLDANTYGFTLQGVNNPDAGPGHGAILAIDNQFLDQFEETAINGPGSAGATLSNPTVISCTYDGATAPTTQPSGLTVDAGDDRFSAAVRQIGGYIFAANAILNTSNNRDAVHWLVVNETNDTVTSEGIITDPNYDFTYPSITANHSGQVLLGFNRTGTTSPAGDIGIYAAIGTMIDGVVTMGSPFVVKSGTVPDFSISFDSQPYRWGDYSATVFDPTDENLIWTIQEIPVSSSAWGTQITLISLATNPPVLACSVAANTATLTWPLSADPGYALQSSGALPNSAWTPVTGITEMVSINQRVVTLTATNQARYFRLKK
ncbi:MAG TPA: hypothetical protein VNX46_00310 [Candidatus Acidoferrum sp.]|nr:hypothetical protein [Candidatus Acidoferrum sp.]